MIKLLVILLLSSHGFEIPIQSVEMKAVHVITKTVTKANTLRAQERRIHEDFKPNNFWMAFDSILSKPIQKLFGLKFSWIRLSLLSQSICFGYSLGYHVIR